MDDINIRDTVMEYTGLFFKKCTKRIRIMMNTNSLRINNEIQIFNYFSRSIDINLCKNLICEILSLNNYLELDKKFISFEINTPEDILLNDQIKIIFNSDFDINIFLYNLAEDKYLRVVKKSRSRIN